MNNTFSWRPVAGAQEECWLVGGRWASGGRQGRARDGGQSVVQWWVFQMQPRWRGYMCKSGRCIGIVRDGGEVGS